MLSAADVGRRCGDCSVAYSGRTYRLLFDSFRRMLGDICGGRFGSCCVALGSILVASAGSPAQRNSGLLQNTTRLVGFNCSVRTYGINAINVISCGRGGGVGCCVLDLDVVLDPTATASEVVCAQSGCLFAIRNHQAPPRSDGPFDGRLAIALARSVTSRMTHACGRWTFGGWSVTFGSHDRTARSHPKHSTRVLLVRCLVVGVIRQLFGCTLWHAVDVSAAFGDVCGSVPSPW